MGMLADIHNIASADTACADALNRIADGIASLIPILADIDACLKRAFPVEPVVGIGVELGTPKERK